MALYIPSLSVPRLDREARSSYPLTIVASDMGRPQRSGSVLLTLEVTDVNDHTPRSGGHISLTIVNCPQTFSFILDTYMTKKERFLKISK